MLDEGAVEELVYERFVRASAERRVTFVELGAGRGAQIHKFLRCRERHAAFTAIEQVFCVPVEANPLHFPKLIRNMRGLECAIIFGAVAEQGGIRKFRSDCGDDEGTHIWSGQLSNMGTLEVPTYTLRQIVAKAGIERITLMHVDIQGEEDNIAADCCALIAEGALGTLYIGTHGAARHDRVRETLRPHLRLLIDAQPNSVSTTPLGDVTTRDGILCFSNSFDLGDASGAAP